MKTHQLSSLDIKYNKDFYNFRTFIVNDFIKIKKHYYIKLENEKDLELYNILFNEEDIFLLNSNYYYNFGYLYSFRYNYGFNTSNNKIISLRKLLKDYYSLSD